METTQGPTPQVDYCRTRFPQDALTPPGTSSQILIWKWLTLCPLDSHTKPSDDLPFLLKGTKTMGKILNKLKIEPCVMASLIDYITENPEINVAQFSGYPDPAFLLKESPTGELVIYQLLNKMDCEWSERRYVMLPQPHL